MKRNSSESAYYYLKTETVRTQTNMRIKHLPTWQKSTQAEMFEPLKEYKQQAHNFLIWDEQHNKAITSVTMLTSINILYKSVRKNQYIVFYIQLGLCIRTQPNYRNMLYKFTSKFNLHHIFGSNRTSTSLCIIIIEPETILPNFVWDYTYNLPELQVLQIIWYNSNIIYLNERNKCLAIGQHPDCLINKTSILETIWEKGDWCLNVR